jgi:hypothetical protein
MQKVLILMKHRSVYRRYVLIPRLQLRQRLVLCQRTKRCAYHQSDRCADNKQANDTDDQTHADSGRSCQ